MLCPECNNKLLPITVKTDTHDVILDYCPVCAGVWSDQGEINFVKPKDLSTLKSVLPKQPQHSPIQHHLCPKDRNTLKLFQGESVPRDISIFRCDVCGGIFFPDGTLSRFKQAQEAKINYFKLWNIPLQSVYTILLPAIVVLLVGAGLVATLYSVQRSTDTRSRAADVISKPLVIQPQPDEAVITFTSKHPATAKIKYWTRPRVITETWISERLKTTHTIHLKGLEVNRDYSYQILLVEPDPVASPVYLFTAQAE